MQKVTTVQRLMKAIEKDPYLMWSLAAILHDAKVAGPWTSDGVGRRVRTTPDGKKIAVVKRHPTRRVNPWEASTRKPSPNEERPQENFSTETEALRWSDAQLVVQGFVLADLPSEGR